MLKPNSSNSYPYRSNSVYIPSDNVTLVRAFIQDTKSITAILKVFGGRYYYIETTDADAASKTIMAYMTIN